MIENEYTVSGQEEQNLAAGMPGRDLDKPLKATESKGRLILLTIVGSQWHFDDEPLVTKYTTEGRLYKKADETVIAYRQSERNGFGKTFATLTLKKDSVVLVWNGDQHMKMIFSPGRRHVSNLSTPEGVMSMGIFTSGVDVSTHVNGGEVHIEYAMDSPDAPALNTKLNIQYRFV